MKLLVYNWYGVGDLYESREFVKDWMRILGVTECDYACRYPCVFADLPQIRCIELTPDMDMRKAWGWNGDEFRLNSWIGCRNAETNPPGDFVLWPGIGCTVEGLYRMNTTYLNEFGIDRLPRSVVEYIPTIDYTKVELGQIPEFLYEEFGKKLVLICNGKTGSGHAANFDFQNMLWGIDKSDDRRFIFTERFSFNPTYRADVFFTDDITGRKPGECDVLAISYFSTFCSVIVGRCSGAQMPCETLQNWMSSDKTLVSFTHHDNGAAFVRDPVALGLKMRRVWSGADNPAAAAEVLKGVLG